VRCGRYTDAIANYKRARALAPRTPSIHAGLGLAHHYTGDLHAAIECYHTALGLFSDDIFSAQMLKCALEEVARKPIAPAAVAVAAVAGSTIV
jgi:tetratricopeptide (TPR) repeat protein